jgi:type I restriction enzyme M protein
MGGKIMANRPYFLIGNGKSNFYGEKSCDFKFYTGFALSQKQKSVKSFHDEILKIYPKAKILEISRRSENDLGISLSAFNLKYKNIDNKEYPIESVFQSSKVFSNGNQYKDLLYKSAHEAKTDERLKKSGHLVKFSLNNTDWELEPKTYFYDYIYLSALSTNKQICERLMAFDTFTDIEFNPQKSFNCQARSVAIAVTLLKNNLLEKYLDDRKLFKTIYITNNSPKQQKLF